MYVYTFIRSCREKPHIFIKCTDIGIWFSKPLTLDGVFQDTNRLIVEALGAIFEF